MADPEAVRDEYRRKLLEKKELESKARALREKVKVARKAVEKTEKALQSEGQIIGEVLGQLDSECLIVKASTGIRYVVGCPNKDDRDKLAAGTQVALDRTTLTIMRALPREMLTTPSSCIEREVLTDVRVRLLTDKIKNLMRNVNDSDIKDGYAKVKHLVVKHLKVAGYSASICQSKWLSSVGVLKKCVPREYEYIDVVFNGDHPDRLIVDINFQAQFQVPSPTEQYTAALKKLPTIFVGTASRLEQILKLMSEEVKLFLMGDKLSRTLVENTMDYLLPTRSLEFMSAKWLSPNFERKSTNASSSKKKP